MTRPEWWPKNPYPKSVFPMTDDEYIKAIPDPVLRTAISGYSGRWVFEMADRMFYKAWKEHEEENIPIPIIEAECAKGGEHEWGIDGQHQNEFCKKCFITKPEL